MNNDPLPLFCGLFCIYPLLFFALPGFVIGRLWRRVKLRSPLQVAPEQIAATARKDKIGYGS